MKNIEENELNEIIRNFENTKYFGYMFFVEYDGRKFESFDENLGKKSVKSEFREILEKNEINIFKGIQQAGRTDANVSAKENVLYINSKNVIEFSKLKITEIDGLKIKKIIKTMPFLEFPQMITKRFYIYDYPKNLTKNSEERIQQICEKISGKKDFSRFTTEKGRKLKNRVREIFVKYENENLYFEGNGFLPQQVRIMSNFILNNRKIDVEKMDFENKNFFVKEKALDGEYLTLERVEFSEELRKICFLEIEKIEELEIGKDFLKSIENIDKIRRIEKNGYFTFFFMEKKDKGEFIGKKGKNVKKLKKIFGNIVVKEI